MPIVFDGSCSLSLFHAWTAFFAISALMHISMTIVEVEVNTVDIDFVPFCVYLSVLYPLAVMFLRVHHLAPLNSWNSWAMWKFGGGWKDILSRCCCDCSFPLSFWGGIFVLLGIGDCTNTCWPFVCCVVGQRTKITTSVSLAPSSPRPHPSLPLLLANSVSS